MDSFADEQSEKRRRGRAAIKKKKGGGGGKTFLSCWMPLISLDKAEAHEVCPTQCFIMEKKFLEFGIYMWSVCDKIHPEINCYT